MTCLTCGACTSFTFQTIEKRYYGREANQVGVPTERPRNLPPLGHQVINILLSNSLPNFYIFNIYIPAFYIRHSQ